MTNASLGFAALADPTRLQIFERLAKKPSSVGKLAERMAVTRPAVSQHLKILKGAGLVSVSQEGTRRIYRIDQRGVESMRKFLDRFWDQALLAFKEAAEEHEA
jgi:DNA-binding transcriptional ArsR family regulator